MTSARLPGATYALMVALAPAITTVVGIAVLDADPAWAEIAGVAPVIAGAAAHRQPADA